MSSKTMTLEQIRQKGLEILVHHLGAVDMIRFFQQSETGWGDYTQDRHKWLENQDVRILANEIMAKRKK